MKTTCTGSVVANLQARSDWKPLFEVVTITEAARLWRKHNLTVRRALSRPGVRFRKSGSVYLISVASCRKLWGEPVCDFDV